MNRTMVLLFISATVFAAESRVQMKDLPEAVQKTVKRETASAKLRGLAKVVENGQTFYEAETTVNGVARDILIDPQGRVVEVEEATSLAKIPPAAQGKIRAVTGTGKILSVERVTRGSRVTYEAAIQKDGKKSEVAVNEDGTTVK